jgi:hypothetical protein
MVYPGCVLGNARGVGIAVFWGLGAIGGCVGFRGGCGCLLVCCVCWKVEME